MNERKTMRLLIIEDNKQLADLLKEELKEYTVNICYTGNEGEEEAFVSSYEAIILDLNLPDVNGLTVLHFLRENKVETPILILTASNEIQVCAKGLDMGADDYLAKPFEFLELRARLRAIIRRHNGKSSSKIEIGNLMIDYLNQRVWINKNEVSLTRKEFDILAFLADRFPEIVSTETLFDYVYNNSLPADSSVLRVHMSRLRKKINEASATEKLKTVHSRGYVLCE